MLIQKWRKEVNKMMVGAAIVGTNTKIVVVCEEETKEFTFLPEDDRNDEELIPKEAEKILLKYGYISEGIPEES